MRYLDRFFTRQIVTRILFGMRDIITCNTSENYHYSSPSYKYLQGPINVPIKGPCILQKQKDKIEKERIQQLLEVISK